MRAAILGWRTIAFLGFCVAYFLYAWLAYYIFFDVEPFFGEPNIGDHIMFFSMPASLAGISIVVGILAFRDAKAWTHWWRVAYVFGLIAFLSAVIVSTYTAVSYADDLGEGYRRLVRYSESLEAHEPSSGTEDYKTRAGGTDKP